MHPQLDTYRTQFHEIKTEAATLVDGVDDARLRTPPDAETWSAAQIFDHMNTAGWLLLSSMESAIQDGHAQGRRGTPPFEYGFVSRWFIRSMKPDSGWTFTAPSVFEPEVTDTLYPSEGLSEFQELQDQCAQCVVDADGLDLRGIRVGSPAVPLLRISLGAWFEATLAHERRHLRQIQTVLGAVSDLY